MLGLVQAGDAIPFKFMYLTLAAGQWYSLGHVLGYLWCGSKLTLSETQRATIKQQSGDAYLLPIRPRPHLVVYRVYLPRVLAVWSYCTKGLVTWQRIDTIAVLFWECVGS